MPRKYVSVAIKKYKDPNTETIIDPNTETIIKAIKDLNDGMSFRKCSEKNNLSVTTLHRHFKAGSTMKKEGDLSLIHI